MQGEPFVKSLVDAGAPGVGELDHREGNLGPHAGGPCLPRGDFGKVVHVGERRDPGMDHLEHGEAGTVADELLVDKTPFEGPHMVGEPGLQRHVLCAAAQQRHRCMAVGVDEPRQDDVVLQP